MPFLKSFLNAAKTTAEVAAPIVAGAFGGPAAAAGTKAIINKVDPPKSTATGSFTPSSAGDVAEARSGDRSRMKRQYGM